jgi:hypothetical protein
MTSTVTWHDYPASKPVAVYERGQVDYRAFYFVELTRKQVVLLVWHASKTEGFARWEWPGGKPFTGDVLRWADQPAAV